MQIASSRPEGDSKRAPLPRAWLTLAFAVVILVSIVMNMLCYVKCGWMPFALFKQKTPRKKAEQAPSAAVVAKTEEQQQRRFIAVFSVGQIATCDLNMLLSSIGEWEPFSVVYVLTDMDTALPTSKNVKVVRRPQLNKYSDLTKQELYSKYPDGGEYPDLFTEVMFVKADIIDHVFQSEPDSRSSGVWFLDTDIILLAPLPIPPKDAALLACPHYRDPLGDGRDGFYNAGMFWTNLEGFTTTWRSGAKSSTFCDQIPFNLAVRQVASTKRVVDLEPQHNFGCWRMFFGNLKKETATNIQMQFSCKDVPGCVGILYKGLPLCSIHVHMCANSQRSKSDDDVEFLRFLKRLTANTGIRSVETFRSKYLQTVPD